MTAWWPTRWFYKTPWSNNRGVIDDQGLVDFALKNRILVLALAIMLFIGGGVAFHQLPVEAYPDVSDNYVEVITQ